MVNGKSGAASALSADSRIVFTISARGRLEIGPFCRSPRTRPDQQCVARYI